MSVARVPRPPVLARLPPGHVAIEASAGTGKTFTLEHLVADLIIQGARLDEILVVTFTEKATREMRARVRATLQRVVQPSEARPPESHEPAWTLDGAVRARLEGALQGFERAPISTIHGFCQRVLAENAFRSGRPLRHALVEPRRAFGAALRDALRSQLARLEMPGEAGERAQLLARWLERLGPDRLEAALFPWLAERGTPRPRSDRAGLDRALRGLPGAAEARVTEALVLGAIGRAELAGKVATELRALGRIADAYRAEGDRGAALFALDAWGAREVNAGEPARRWLPGRLREASTTVRGQDLVPLREKIDALLTACPPSFGVLVQELVPLLRTRLAAQKSARGELDFDDLLLELRAALDGPGGTALAASLRRRYRHALVDEFQDTDEVQWAIFRRLWLEPSDPARRLFLIGDPKQAIYGFRNADLHTYEAARDAVAPEGPVRLDVCFRATARLAAAYDRIFAGDGDGDGAPFFRGRLVYRGVRAGRPERRATSAEGRDAPAVVLWQPRGRDKPRLADVRRTLGRRIAEEARALVEGGALTVGGEPLGYGDLHVLTRTAREAEGIAAAFRIAGVPHAFFKQDGLFGTDEARHVLALLRAIDEPYDRSARLKAWLTPFFAVPIEELSACRDLDAQHPLVAPFFRWRRLAERQDAAALLRALLEETGLVQRLLFAEDGDRALTNVQHVLELLLEESGGRRELPELVARLDAWVAGRAEPLVGGTLQRKPGDRPAVQLLTMHKSKGLEAEVVFVAGGFGRARGGGGDLEPLVCHDDEGRREAWHRPVPEEVEARAEGEAREEEERLLYVALTRAKARLYLPYFGLSPASAGPQEGQPPNPPRGPYRWLDRRLEQLVTRGYVDGDAVTYEVLEVGAEQESAPVAIDALRDALGSFAFPRLPDAAAFAALRRERAGWLLTSYTRLEAGRQLGARHAAPEDAGDEEHAMPLADAPEAAGAPEAESRSPAGDAPSAADPAARLPGGAGMGIFLHEVLEELDFGGLEGPSDASEWLEAPGVRRLFEARARRSGVEATALEDAAAVLFRALRQPQAHGSLSLPSGFAGLGPERAVEMRFHFPLPEAGHPMLGTARGPSPSPAFTIERGVIRGVVDLVFAHEGRVYVLDWKSDRIAPDALEAHVRDHYALQARLYTLGVARHLGLRDAEDYEARFGGLLYAFLRAMRGPSEGVVFARPSWDEVCGWERELRAERPFGYRLRPEEGIGR